MKEIIDIYFKDIRKTSPFTYVQEQELAREIQAGSKEALDRLVSGNLRFVVSEARRFLGRGMELPDLIQEGNIGLIKAAEKFDPEAGFRFITYAVWWIRQSIFSALSESKLVRLPMNMVGVANQVSRAVDLIRSVECREPSEVELAKMVGVSTEDVRIVLSSMSKATSLSKPVGDGEDDGTIGDLIEDVDSEMPDTSLRSEDCILDLTVVLKEHLSEREAKILISNYGIGCTAMSDDQVGKEFGISEERVRQIKLAAVKKLKKNQEVLDTLRPYLG